MTSWVQPDLFGEMDAREQARREWEAKFERADWVAPWDTAGGMKQGESKPGWRCPSCAQVEPNAFLLSINHGFDPEVPGHAPFDGQCFRARREARAASSDTPT